jgi:flagellar export protein FliJ
VAGTTFKFKFQRVLDLREQQQQALEGELAEVQKRLGRAEASVQRWLKLRRETLEEQGHARRKGRLGLDARYGDYLSFVRRKLSEARRELAVLTERREGIRNRIEDLLKARKLLETYRDQLKEEFYDQVLRDEQKLLDMHAIYSHIQAGETA